MLFRAVRELFWRNKRRRPQLFKPVILVTGCGSGIGLALAQILFEKLEYRVVVTARLPSLPFLISVASN
jgi:NADPH:quinone reductase-like Zn-dependent oxidoreductase